MKKISYILLDMLVFACVPFVSNAAGTYYNGNLYQNPQQRYTNKGYNYNNSYTSKYGNAGKAVSTKQSSAQAQKSSSNAKNSTKKSGFVLDLDLSHELSNWNFDMKTEGSKLHYDNIAWNVLSADMKYYMDSSTPLELQIGARYGFQFGDSSMIDDDISNGGIFIQTWSSSSGVLGYQTEHALSVGKTEGGNQFGFNIGLGLTDFFSVGNIKITPSIGYRYLKYKLKTQQNYGITIDTFEGTSAFTSPNITCITGDSGEVQCDPFLIFVNETSGDTSISGRYWTTSGNETVLSDIMIPSGVDAIDPAGTYYYEQSGTSHSYETIWAGPYLALDMVYDINKNNNLDAGIELGLPVYNSKGDQPYRYDWAHPTSVEDSGGFGDAIHLGLKANWSTAITDSVNFSLGFTYDYYSVSDAKATTYLNSSLYSNTLDTYETLYESTTDTTVQAALLEEIEALEDLESAGWKQEKDSEIKSVYKSMGIRLGVSAKF